MVNQFLQSGRAARGGIEVRRMANEKRHDADRVDDDDEIDEGGQREVKRSRG